jgi:hypothetical protein
MDMSHKWIETHLWIETQMDRETMDRVKWIETQ